METVRTQYIEFYLIDPDRIADQGIKGATVMTIGALYHGDYLNETSTGSAANRRATQNRGISDLVHFIKDRKCLARCQSVNGHIVQIYHCARCGGRLGLRQCDRCHRPYDPASALFVTSVASPVIPPKVLRYAQQHGHRFEVAPPRP